MFFWAFKPTLLAQLFTPFYLLRRFLHLALVAWFKKQSFVPNSLQLLIGIAFLGYIVAVRPFRAGIATLTVALMELCTILM